MPKIITHIEDESTLGDSTVIAMDANGCCTRHPHIQLRVKGDDGLIYQQESCSECDKEFREERLSLKEKKAELDRQLQQLSEAPQPPAPASALPGLGGVNGLSNGAGSSMGPTGMGGPAGMGGPTVMPGAAGLAGTGMPGATALSGMPGASATAYGAPGPAAPSGFPPTTPFGATMNGGMGAGGGMDLFQQQMMRMQQMQDWMLESKERELVFLRQKVEEMQQLLIKKEVELALVKEKLSTQEQRMQQELKLIKMAALNRSKDVSENDSRRSSKQKGGSGQREIHIQELHVSVGGSAADPATGQVDPERVKAATAAATSAAISSAEEAVRSNDGSSTDLGVMHVDLNGDGTAVAKKKEAPASEFGKNRGRPMMGAAAGAATMGGAAAMMKSATDDSEDESSHQPEGNHSTASRSVPSRFESKGESQAMLGMGDADEDDDIMFTPTMSKHTEEPSVETTDDSDEAGEGEDTFEPDPSAVNVPVTRSTGNAFSTAKTQGPLTKANEKPLDNPNPSKRDPMRASQASIPPPAHSPGTNGGNEDSKMPVVVDLNQNGGKATLPTKRELDASGTAPDLRGISIPTNLEFSQDYPDAVPLQEEVTIGTLDQQSLVGTIDDNKSVGNTVASSTYGEDRQKVHNQTLLDPYGDRGSYSGIVLRSTGMPHGLGRMVYEDDGRTYEGDWRHGRWHGYGRATFANGDSYEGEYRFDQRHGRGIYCWSDGRVYDGAFSEDKRHGKGTFKWPDGATYEGDFVQGQREGHGRYTFSDGGYYVGSWVDGRYEGHGVCHWEDGRTYKGEWRAGMAHGMGVETYPDGRVRHDGQWKNDEPVRT